MLDSQAEGCGLQREDSLSVKEVQCSDLGHLANLFSVLELADLRGGTDAEEKELVDVRFLRLSVVATAGPWL